MFYFTMVSVSRLYGSEWWDEWQMVNWRGFRGKWSWPNESIIIAFA